jgi:hypothetical protein
MVTHVSELVRDGAGCHSSPFISIRWAAQRQSGVRAIQRKHPEKVEGQAEEHRVDAVPERHGETQSSEWDQTAKKRGEGRPLHVLCIDILERFSGRPMS